MTNYSDMLPRLPENYTFGLELEFTGGLTYYQTTQIIQNLIDKGVLREGWTVHYDSSVVDENQKGAEIVSPVLKDDEQTKRELEIITRIIKNYGGVMGAKTGGHIHYGVQCLGDDIHQIQNFFKLYTIFEPLLYKLSAGDLGYVRPGARDFAKPVQKGLNNVIDANINSYADLFSRIAANIGAIPTHYGPYRYYGLNFQRITEAIRKMPPKENIEEFMGKMLRGETIYDGKGNKLSPTIEMRFRNGSSSADEILRGVRLGGQMFVAAKDPCFDKMPIIKSLYRDSKKKNQILWTVTQENLNDPRYAGLTPMEIVEKKFADSRFGNGQIDKNTFLVFLGILYRTTPLDNTVTVENRMKLYELYKNSVQKTPTSRNTVYNSTRNNIRETLNTTRRYIEYLRNNQNSYRVPALRSA